ncbi:MAG: CDP-glycerol glycerophosphotransferase family protein [Candidatus Hydrogenedentes bacterium]|nr:CDP-glycerol glycerophosphotransferase family protein [Candidatus Hydrogenedentota bacterium]
MSNKTVIFVDVASSAVTSEVARLYRDSADGVVVCLDDESGEALRTMGVGAVSFRDYLKPDDWLRIDRDAVAWLKGLPETVIENGTSLKERFSHRGVSLWWAVEESLFLNGGLFDLVKIHQAVQAIIDREQPARVVAFVRDKTWRAVLTHRAGHVHCELVFDESVSPERLSIAARLKTTAKRLLKCTFAVAGAFSPMRCVQSVLVWYRRARNQYRPVPGGILVMSFVPYSWRVIHDPKTGDERMADSYWDAVERCCLSSGTGREVRHLAVRSNRAQDVTMRGRWRYNVRLLKNIPDYVPLSHYGGIGTSLRVGLFLITIFRRWRRTRTDPRMKEVFTYGGVDFSAAMLCKLENAVYGFLPQFVRVFEEMSVAARKERPCVALLNGETTALGRTLIAACRAAGVPTVGMQHGCISVIPSMHASYYHTSPDSVNHESTDNRLGCPIPTRTVIWGDYFERLLIETMHYPPEALAVTGNPRYDLLAYCDRYDRDKIRNRLGLDPAKFTILFATAGASMKSDFQPPHNNRVHLDAILDCIDQMDDVQMVVKLHPLDDISLYGHVLDRARSHPAVQIVNEFDILSLLSVVDLLICRYSGTIIEAAAFDKPAVNLNLLGTPDNIEFVTEGGALGVTKRSELREAVRALSDPNSPASRSLRDKRADFIRRWMYSADGKSAERVKDVVITFLQ